MPRRQIPGVFCLESNWSSDLRDRSSLRPLLELLEQQKAVEAIHRDCGTVDEFEHYLDISTQARYEKYRLLYLGFHGGPGLVRIGGSRVEIEQIAEALDGRAKNTTVYFGTCSTLDVPVKRLDKFLTMSGAKAVCGFRKDVGWLESAAFDLLIIEALTRYRRMDFAEKWLRKAYPSTVRRLGFRMRRR